MAILIKTEGIQTQQVKNEAGEVLLEFTYNPSDIHTLQKFWNLLSLLYADGKTTPEITQQDIDLLQKPLDTGEDFAAAAVAAKKVAPIFTQAAATFSEITSAIDDIFGKGVSDVFCQGYADPSLLEPLFTAVLPHFEQAAAKRRQKVDEYTQNRKEKEENLATQEAVTPAKESLLEPCEKA